MQAAAALQVDDQPVGRYRVLDRFAFLGANRHAAQRLVHGTVAETETQLADGVGDRAEEGDYFVTDVVPVTDLDPRPWRVGGVFPLGLTSAAVADPDTELKALLR